jgi:ribosomal protein S18 acetylase RimI-like enzyme
VAVTIRELTAGRPSCCAPCACAHTLRLGVMSDMTGSVRFYERLGFTRTGPGRPLTRDPARLWIEMIRPL